MALKVNDLAPDFSLPSTSGKIFNLYNDARNKPCIIYFYPKDFTPGCTQEACEFRDQFSFFKELDINVYGISRDSLETHLKFQKQYNLPFQLLADTKGEVAESYGAVVPVIKMTRRITYLLDKSHHIAGVYVNLFSSTRHIREMIEMVNETNITA